MKPKKKQARADPSPEAPKVRTWKDAETLLERMKPELHHPSFVHDSAVGILIQWGESILKRQELVTDSSPVVEDYRVAVRNYFIRRGDRPIGREGLDDPRPEKVEAEQPLSTKVTDAMSDKWTTSDLLVKKTQLPKNEVVKIVKKLVKEGRAEHRKKDDGTHQYRLANSPVA